LRQVEKDSDDEEEDKYAKIKATNIKKMQKLKAQSASSSKLSGNSKMQRKGGDEDKYAKIKAKNMKKMQQLEKKEGQNKNGKVEKEEDKYAKIKAENIKKMARLTNCGSTGKGANMPECLRGNRG